MTLLTAGVSQNSHLTRFNKIAIQARAQMAADKEDVGLSRVHCTNLSVSCPYEKSEIRNQKFFI